MGKNDTALTLLQQLLDQYAAAGDTAAETMPAAPKILAQDLKARLQPKESAPAAAPAPASAPAG